MAQERLVVAGLNHKKAPIALREKLAFRSEEVGPQVGRMAQEAGASEGVLLSTCNRVEAYIVSADPEAEDRLMSFLGTSRGLSVPEFRPYMYVYTGQEAVTHLFEVTSSLDSMVVGETQIIAQVKEAYEIARQEGSTSRLLNPLFQKALNVAKMVHTATRLSEGNLSVPSVAAKLAGKIFDDLSRQSVLIVGAGEVGELTLQAFRDAGVARMRMCNRTVEKAEHLVKQFGGVAYPLTDLPGLLSESDIIIMCLNSAGYELTLESVTSSLAQRKNRPMYVIDLAVPRNVHPAVHRLEQVYLFNVDDLQTVVDLNQTSREEKLTQCRAIIRDEVADFIRQWDSRDVARIVQELQVVMNGWAEEEARKTLSKLSHLAEKDREEVRYLAQRLANRILHQPIQALKDYSGDGQGLNVPDAVRKIFNLNRM